MIQQVRTSVCMFKNIENYFITIVTHCSLYHKTDVYRFVI